MGFAVVVGGLALHLMLLLSVFDIYFRSPIVQDVEPHWPLHAAAARRLVLFSVDGMRAESFLEHERSQFLRSVAQSRGIWGISNTRVPTESRPGHVAIVAGFYEDPSAVTRGWKKNPVDFDSVFNQSRYTWSWGADDILHIFSKGNNDGHIFTIAYNTEDQTFSTDKNTTLLDGWVFHKVRTFFQTANSNKVLMNKLHEDKIVFFLHLLGMDTSGHTHKPNNEEFIVNMKYVDEGIAKMEEIIEEFYGHDNQTTYLMTSDHGMTDWGSHGAGDKHETETPYVVWGASIAQTIPGAGEGHKFGLPANRRKDIAQADFAPLMSTIISVPVPVNSIGKFPADLLDITLENKAKAIYSNARQLASQYNTLREQVEQNAVTVLYYPFQPLTSKKYKEVIAYTEKLMEEAEYEKLIVLSEEIMHLSLAGLVYYHNYYQNVLLAFISLSFIGWIALLLTLLLEQTETTDAGVNTDNLKMSQNKRQHVDGWKWNLAFSTVSIILVFLISVQRLPIQYCLYSLVPVMLWWRIISSTKVWMATLNKINRHHYMTKILIQIICYTLGTVALVWSFAQRWWLSAPLAGVAVWPFVSTERRRLSWSLLLFWAASCLLLGVFSFLPIVGKDTHISLVVSAGVIRVTASVYFLSKILLPLCHSGQESRKEIIVIVLQTVLLILALQNIYVQSTRFEESSPVVAGYQVIAWLLAGASLIMPMFSSTRQVIRLFAINCGLMTFYLLLSVSHEGLFLISLTLNQACWLLLEFQLSHFNKTKLKELTFGYNDSDNKNQSLLSVERSLTEHDYRRAYFFLLYIILSFFGTGNIASINSFEVRWVTCFVTTFRPFMITTLILCKTMVPFLVVACTFRAISIITKAPTGYLIVIVFIFSDMMGVQFLHCVRNTGSWLQIGTSISQYVIAQVITVFIVVLHSVSKVLCEKNVSRFVVNIFKSRKKYV